MRRIRFALLAAAAVAGIACAADPTSTSSSSPATVARADRVLLVSVDGLRGDALRRMPTLWAIAQSGAWTDSARTITPSLTLPGHLALLTGRDVSTLGVTTNDLSQRAALALAGAGATSLFQWVRAAGGTSAAVVGASLIPQESRGLTRDFLGIDSLAVTSLDASAVADAAVPLLATTGRGPRLVFVHFSDVDLAGHANGWVASAGSDSLGDAYLRAAAHVDSAVARLYATVAADVAAGRTTVVVTADHGGGAGAGCTANVEAMYEHCTSSPADVTIPLVIVGAAAPHGRLPHTPGITQVARTIGDRLGISAAGAAGAAIGY